MHSNARGNARFAICFSLSLSPCDNKLVREKLILLLTFVLFAAVFMKSGAAKSNIPEHGDGRNIYEVFVRPAMLSLTAVGAHYTISTLFQDNDERNSIYSYSAAM
jgi:hypothetical protein